MACKVMSCKEVEIGEVACIPANALIGGIPIRCVTEVIMGMPSNRGSRLGLYMALIRSSEKTDGNKQGDALPTHLT